MTRRPPRGLPLLAAAAIAAIAAGALSACGKKGGLDLPPAKEAAKTALDESPSMPHADGRRAGRSPEAGTPWIISHTATASSTPRA